MPFASSLDEARVQLCFYTESYWLRSTFNMEKGGNNNQLPAIHVHRWLEKNENPSDIQTQLIPVFSKLGLVDEVKWPEEKVSHVVVHGALELYASARIKALSDFEGDLIYMTNPRMLFNWEPSFAPILASWFDNWFDRQELAIQRIKAVLDQHIDLKTSDKNWLQSEE